MTQITRYILFANMFQVREATNNEPWGASSSAMQVCIVISVWSTTNKKSRKSLMELIHSMLTSQVQSFPLTIWQLTIS